MFNTPAPAPADRSRPTDIRVPGCPPRPEALTHGILKLRTAILNAPDMDWRTRYGGRGTEEVIESMGLDPTAGHSVGVSGGGRAGTSA